MVAPTTEPLLDAGAARSTLWSAARRFVPYLKPHLGWVLLAVLMSLITSLATVALMYTVMVGISSIIVGDLAGIRTAALNFLVIVVVEQLVRVAYISVQARLNEQLAATMRNDLVIRLHNAELSRHANRDAGGWITRLFTETERLRGFFTKTLLEASNALIWFAVILVFLFALNPFVAMPVLVVIPLLVYIAGTWNQRLTPYHRQQREAWQQVVGRLNQDLDGLADIRAFGQEEYTLAKLRQGSENYSVIHNRLSFKRIWLTSYTSAAVHISLAGLIFIGGLVALSGQQLGSGLFFQFATGLMPMTWMLLGEDTMMAAMGMANGLPLLAGALAAFSLFAWRMLNPVRNLALQVGEISEMGVIAQRLLEVLELPEEDDAGDELPPVRGHLEVDHVTFGYGDGSAVLRDVTLRVEPGQHVGLMGPTGAGKTTLTQLIVGLYRPESGSIRIDGHDLTGVTRRSLRRQVVLVAQDPQLFDGTLAENIRFHRPEATEIQIAEAAHALGADAVLAKLPDGLQTKVGERGSRLSIGERQLVALTRAMLTGPRMIIIDEAVSSVNPELQRTVVAAIRRLLEGRTAILITHWPELVDGLDRVFVLDEGRIVDSGEPRGLDQSHLTPRL